MTSTELTIGLGGSQKISSRVLKPPGGGSSDIFGAPEEVPQQARTDRNASNILNGDPAPAANPAPAEAAAQEAEEAAPELEEEEEDQEADAAAAGDAAAPEPPQPKQPATSTRVRQPPGGHSTPLW